MSKHTWRWLVVLCAITMMPGAAPVLAAQSYTEFYGDVVSNALTGNSALQDVKVGRRDQALDYYVFARNEYYDTHGAAVPYAYSERGAKIGLGVRHWFAAHRVFGGVSAAPVVSGPHEGRTDFRAGFAGYDERVTDDRLTETYGEAFWVSLGDDCIATLRVRSGAAPSQSGSRCWFYAVGQLWKSATGDNAAENRAELGYGAAWRIRDWGRVNLELRGGYAFSGEIDQRAYLNPTLIISGGF